MGAEWERARDGWIRYQQLGFLNNSVAHASCLSHKKCI